MSAQAFWCEGKAAFDSRVLASKAAKRRTARDVYRCITCRKWHVGTKHWKKAR